MNRLGEHTQHVGYLNDAPFIATRDSKGCLHNVPVVMLQLEEGLIHGLIFSFVPPKYVQTKQYFLSFPWGYDSFNSFLSAHSFPLSLVLRLPLTPTPLDTS